jgi:hypothetical protein
MSTFLELCQDVRAAAGLSGTGPATVVGQSGMYGNIVRWTQQAYAEILRMHPWAFLWARVSPVLTIGQADYIGTDFTPDVTDLGLVYREKMYDLTSTNRPRLYFRDWDSMDQAQATAATGAPRYFSRRPDKKLTFYPTPDAAYEIQFDYLREGHVLAADADEPLIPDDDLQQIIVYKALQYYALFDENSAALTDGQRGFAMLLSQMHERYGAPMDTSAGPLDSAPLSGLPELV